MVYNSWLTMQQLGETDADTCAYNDLALIRIDPADVGKVNPSIPFFGGPTGLRTAGTALGDQVYSYGNSELRARPHASSARSSGVSLGDAGNGWSHTVYTVTPGIPGDSGSAFVDANGKALGVLSTVAIAPLAGSQRRRRPRQGARVPPRAHRRSVRSSHWGPSRSTARASRSPVRPVRPRPQGGPVELAGRERRERRRRARPAPAS